ncbi:MAG: hypothetical protein V1772_08975 [Chloroflexota bacterium]
MLGDLTEKIQASANKIEKLVATIPGYAGYKQKEQRREADKLLRLHVAREYEAQLKRANKLQYDLSGQGQLRVIVALDRAISKLQLLVDRIRNASYGYAGLFDAVKVDEATLDALYEFDQAMLEGVQVVAARLDKLAELAGGDGATVSDVNELVAEMESLNATFGQRQDVVLR